MTQQPVTFEWVVDESKTNSSNAPVADGDGRALGLDNAEQQIAIRLLRGLALLMIVVVAAAGAGHPACFSIR